MNSIWKTDFPSFQPQAGDRKTDVLVVGGGITGILCAWSLTRVGVDCLLIEAGRLCSGVTANTTAKITFQHGLKYDKLLRTLGQERARLYLAANRDALKRYRELCRDIACDFEETDAYVYATDDREKLEAEIIALEKLGYSAQFTSELPLPFPTAGAVRFPRQAQFHPLKFLRALCHSLEICENTKLLELAPGRAVTDHGTIRAKNIIISTRFPLLNKHGSYFLKLYQERSYVLALEGAPRLNGMYIDQKTGGLSFRNYENMLLLGGGSHRTGKQSRGWMPLTEAAAKYYPQAAEVCRWATQDCMTLDDMPYIGQYSARTPGLYAATGYGKWGMTSAMTAATVLTDLIVKGEDPYDGLFSPSRSILHSQLAINGLEAVKNLLTPTAPRCPHLGCALKWNKQERSWDCPCHGSRFASDGALLNNPATDGLRTPPGQK